MEASAAKSAASAANAACICILMFAAVVIALGAADCIEEVLRVTGCCLEWLLSDLDL
jgi:hypothetical protein